MAVHNNYWYVQLLTLPVYQHGAHDSANDLSCWHSSLCRILLVPWLALPQNEAGLRHYLDTIMRTDERV